MNRKVFFIIFLFFGGVMSVDVTANIFDFHSFGARSIALGGSYTGLASGAEAIPWNPASTVFGNFNGYTMFYSNPYGIDSFRHLFGGLVFVKNIGKKGLAVSYGGGVGVYGYSKYYSETSYILNSAIEFPIELTLSKFLNIGVGINVSYLTMNITGSEYSYGDSVLNIDGGVKIEFLPFFIGFSMKNINEPKLEYSVYSHNGNLDRSIPIERNMRLGAGVDFEVVIFSVDYAFNKSVSFGIELNLFMFSLRYGMKSNLNINELYITDISGKTHNFGLGLKLGKDYSLDVALSLLSGMQSSNQWSASVSGRF